MPKYFLSVIIEIPMVTLLGSYLATLLEGSQILFITIMNEDKLTTFIGFIGLLFAVLGAFGIIQIESVLLIEGIATSLISYYTKK